MTAIKPSPAVPPRPAGAGADTAILDEASARRVLLLRACETVPAPPALWSPEDRAWASRLASETAGSTASAARWLDERARHACERLLPRDQRVAALLQRRLWRPGATLAVAGAALALGLLADSLGGSRHINLLAPPMWAVVAWNLLVYLLLGWRLLRPRAARGTLRRLVQRMLQRRAPGDGGVLAAFGADWVQRAGALSAARAALLLHVAAAALACGLVAGLYLRGLGLDYRAGWESTFLEPGAVHALLATLLAPASALSGIALPDAAGVAALRFEPGAGGLSGAAAGAARWIHLYAVTLALFVIVPRLGLAALAAAVAWRRARRFEIALAEPYFQRLLAQARRAQAKVQVLPHGAAPSAQAVLALRALLVAAYGDAVELRFAPTVAYGEEGGDGQGTGPVAAEPGTTLRLALFDLATTPEPETQGRFVRALAASALPLVLLADESAYRKRFASLPQRLEERRAAWRRFGDAQGLGVAFVDLDAPDPAGAQHSLAAALAVALAVVR